MESPKALMCPLEKGDRGINKAAETQEAFVKDNETVEAEALEDAEAGVTVTVAVPRKSVTEQEAATELDKVSELEEASELEAAMERTMTCAQPLNGLIVMVLPAGRSTSLNPGSPLPQPRRTAFSTLTSSSVSGL